MDKSEELVKAVFERSQEIDGIKKLACAEAFKLAHEFQVETIEIGCICNQQKIKICKCQLGCFP
jgi:hypothetical protein